jgi:hypothetical protein
MTEQAGPRNGLQIAKTRMPVEAKVHQIRGIAADRATAAIA